MRVGRGRVGLGAEDHARSRGVELSPAASASRGELDAGGCWAEAGVRRTSQAGCAGDRGGGEDGVGSGGAEAVLRKSTATCRLAGR